MLVGLETRQNGQLQQQAFSEVRQEYGRYFDALEQHPRSLVGTEVPSTKGEGTEILRDSKDAAEWQEEVKHLLTMEVKDRASRRADAVRPMMETLHAAVGIFQQNPDLIPKTKQFDKELADKFAELAKPYELRVDGKLVGYSIPVQPLVNQVRSQLAASRAAAAPAAPAAPSAQQQRAAEAPRNDIGQFHNPDAPQAGISSKAGNSSSDGEDFSTLFGTIGLPGLRI